MFKHPIDRRSLLGAGLAAGLTAFPSAARSGNNGQAPNIVFILADDLGYADLGCYGSRHNVTPVLDKLARQGLLFRNAYASSPVCSPTRVALATGMYPNRFRIGLEEPLRPEAQHLGLPVQTKTLPGSLRDSGYTTWLVGKWHVGHAKTFSPLKYGYDHFFGIPAGAADHFSYRADLEQVDPDDGLIENGRRIERQGYLTDVFTDEAIRLIKSHPHKPFFLSLHLTAPHWPWEGPEDIETSKRLKTVFDPHGGSLETYRAMLRNMDDNIGRILSVLDENGLSNDTIVVFTSDNGGERYSDTWPLTGVKGELLEGGIRVPLIVRWPKYIASNRESEQVIVTMDWAPTLLAASGRPSLPIEWDGLNLISQFKGIDSPIERKIFWRYKSHNQAAVRYGHWKYLKLGGKEHLFNIESDPRERLDLKSDYPEIFSILKSDFTEWNNNMIAYPEESFSEDVLTKYTDRY